MFKSKAPEKDSDAVANAAEVMGKMCNGNTPNLTNPWRVWTEQQKREQALASAQTCRLSATSNAMVQRRYLAESKANCAPQIS
jgi:hypothetical protein